MFTTDAASEGNANMVCKLPSGEEENERSEVKKNSTLQHNESSVRNNWIFMFASTVSGGEHQRDEQQEDKGCEEATLFSFPGTRHFGHGRGFVGRASASPGGPYGRWGMKKA
ncbi:hypothetical protein [uncultured Rikenella sp.]|uniref:hypothetical protein n=1 Tax=uncultured Rikenella sp. TaxID=368003 RepID=UPI0026086877|nr:hypothetical protein [uncultured Rikenella sp.]